MSTVDLLIVPREHHPDWAKLNWFDLMRAGVLYTDLSLRTWDEFLAHGRRNVPAMYPIAAFAGVGPKCFYDRDDGPWLAWDPNMCDENVGGTVADRDHPWCFGDEIWIALSWCGMYVVVHLANIDDVKIFCLSPTQQMNDSVWRATVRKWASSVVGPHLHEIERRDLFRLLMRSA